MVNEGHSWAEARAKYPNPRFPHIVMGPSFMKQHQKTRKKFIKKGSFQTKGTMKNLLRMRQLIKKEQLLLYLKTFNHTKQMESLIRHRRRICRRLRSWSWDETEPFVIDAAQVKP